MVGGASPSLTFPPPSLRSESMKRIFVPVLFALIAAAPAMARQARKGFLLQYSYLCCSSCAWREDWRSLGRATCPELHCAARATLPSKARSDGTEVWERWGHLHDSVRAGRRGGWPDADRCARHAAARGHADDAVDAKHLAQVGAPVADLARLSADARHVAPASGRPVEDEVRAQRVRLGAKARPSRRRGLPGSIDGAPPRSSRPRIAPTHLHSQPPVPPAMAILPA